ncbi:unnamed protein product [Pipistrellus nathusii]|uniref:Uncharacterized protein n=1 Tax=Pipistrellus nathusii TaxID=59473 RepID=A0ABN9ZYI9_PIPNA
MPWGRRHDDEVMRLVPYSRIAHRPHYRHTLWDDYKIFLSQVKTVSVTDGSDFGKINGEKKLYVNATFVVKIPEAHESKIQITILTVTVTVLYNIHNGRNVTYIHHCKKHSVSRNKLSYACCGNHHFQLARIYKN